MNPPASKAPKPTRAQFENTDRLASEHRYDRQRPLGGRVAALDRLHDTMVANAKLFQGSRQNKRDAIVGQLSALQDYLAAQGFALPTLEPLMHPRSALVEREQNRLDLVFSERNGGGRPKRSLKDEERTGALAAISDLWLDKLKDDDRTQRQKLAALARRISGGWFGDVTVAKLQSAREIVSQAPKDNQAVGWANLYREANAVSLNIWDHDTSIEILVNHLNRVHPTN